MAIREVTKYVTDDGKEFFYRSGAEHHAEELIKINSANDALNEGKSIAEALTILGRSGFDPILEKVTCETKLVISHWQCREEPGYRPVEFRPNGELFIYGHAGSWSGSYGNEVPIMDLVRYAKDPRTIF